MPVDYEGAYEKAYQRNVKRAVKDLDRGKLDKKITNFCAQHGFSKKSVEAQIRKNRYLRATFAINPNRQNIYEKTAAKYIKEITGVTEFKKLPQSGERAKYVGVLTGSGSTAKAIDFSWEFAGKQFYASHKYTKQGGGTQGSQYNELLAFIKEANRSTLSGTYFVAIADGKFYREKNGQVGITRIANLKRKANSSKGVHACDIDELEKLMKAIT